MNQVHVPRVAREREVVAVGKQRIERAERVVSGLVIARRRIDLQPEKWGPRLVGDGVATAAPDGPGADTLVPDVAELGHRVEAPVQPAARAGAAGSEGGAALSPPG